MERCIGCHSCSLACARLVYKKLSWSTAGIRIHSLGGVSTGFEPRMCLACDPAPCVLACPTCAFSQAPGGGVRLKRELCIRCGKCAAACPVDAVYLEPETGDPYVCVQCGQCPRFCPHECLEMQEVGRQRERQDEILATETAHHDACAIPPRGEPSGSDFEGHIGPVESPEPGRKEVPDA
jgi:Fe-S-cluster-containing dehydrogenase component